MKLLAIFLLSTLSLSGLAARSKEERKQLFESATQKLKESGIENKIPKKGDDFPDLEIGKKKVSEYLKKGPLVVTFYRGGWCPYCVQQLKELDSKLTLLIKSDAKLIAISPETTLEVKKTKSKNNLEFQLVSDDKHKLARELGLVFKVDDEVAKEYKALGIDLVKSQGNEAQELPVPATFVINKDQKIEYAFADADYTKRAPITEIIEAVKVANEKGKQK